MLVQDPNAARAANQDVAPPVSELAMIFDEPRAAHLEYRRSLRVARLEARLEARNRHGFAPGERVAHEIAIARLEDVQRERDAGEQRDVRQWKDGKGAKLGRLDGQGPRIRSPSQLDRVAAARGAIRAVSCAA